MIVAVALNVVDDEKQCQQAGCYGCHRIYVLNKPHCNLHVVHQPVFCNKMITTTSHLPMMLAVQV
jgi:hypothetical protein